VTCRHQLGLAVAMTSVVLVAAAVRALLTPVGALVSTGAFIACLAATWLAVRRAAAPAARLPIAPSLMLGIAVAGLLLAPLPLLGPPTRTLHGFVGWGAGTALVATLEEAAVRGTLQGLWTRAVGVPGGLLASAVVFAGIHLPAYGPSAMPVDLTVGLVLAGLRALTGRVAPCALAHVGADWAAWFWS
jgi:membrane protease YdiL (CAAX protease family)